MPKVDNEAEQNDELLASSLTRTVKAASAETYTQKTISSMFAKKAGTRIVSSARKKVLDAQVEVNDVEATEASGSAQTEKIAPVPSSSTSQIQIPIKLTLDTLEKDTMDPTWYEALKGEFTKPYFKELKKFLATEMGSNTVYPSIENIYSWSRLTPLDKVKVIVIGQDPYHDVGQAHGLSFSVLPPNKPPPSLRNIYKQLQSDFPAFIPPKDTGDLSPVASQGVLWLNSSLTVRAHKAGSHGKRGWEIFTTHVLRTILQRKGHIQGVVFLAWGAPAQKTCSAMSMDKKKNLLLQSAHPSPLSANRGFIGNQHFKRSNEWLVSKYGEGAGVDWMVLSAKKP